MSVLGEFVTTEGVLDVAPVNTAGADASELLQWIDVGGKGKLLGFSAVTAAKSLDLFGCALDMRDSAVTAVCVDGGEVPSAGFYMRLQGVFRVAVLAACG